MSVAHKLDFWGEGPYRFLQTNKRDGHLPFCELFNHFKNVMVTFIPLLGCRMGCEKRKTNNL